ncbi:MAG: tripartite tricarboxylate transporter substrate binding protein [Variovorax sp.]
MTIQTGAFRAFCRVLAFVLTSIFAALPASAEDKYPDHSITAVVPNAAGGALDVYARIISKHLGERLGQRVIVQNIVGAGTATGSRAVLDAKPDGYTLLVHHQALMGISAQGILGRPFGDLVPLARTGGNDTAFVTRKGMSFTDLKSLQAYAKANPGKVRMGVFLTAHSHYVALEFMEALGIEMKMINVPGGDAPLRAALLGEHIDVMLATPSTSRSYVAAGDFVPLAFLADYRSRDMPNVTTAVEQGFPQLVTNVTNYWWARKETPQPVLDLLTTKLEETMASPELKAELGAQIEDLRFAKGDALGKEVAEQYALFERLTKNYGLEKRN